MSIDTSITLLIQQQETILNIFNNKSLIWDNKIDADGGILQGPLKLSTFGLIDPITETFGIGTSNPINLLTIKSPTVDIDTIVSILSNRKGNTILTLGFDDLINISTPSLHSSKIEFNSTNNKTTLLKNSDDSFNILHEGLSELNISCYTDTDINFLTNKINRLAISKITGNILINSIVDNLVDKLQVSGSVSILNHLKLYESLIFKSTDPLISQSTNSSYIRLTGGSTWLSGGASILLTGKDYSANPFQFQVFTTPMGTASLTIDEHKNAKFTGIITTPTMQLESAIINGITTLPQLLFKDSTQPSNNKVWQAKSEDKDFVIRTLDDLNNPSIKEVRFVRSPTSNDMSQIIFGDLNDVSIDMVSSTININNLKIIGRRQTGWKNVTNITNFSKDLQLIAADNSELAKVVRALINDLISHGLIGL